jgi:hypothetical protein
MDFRQLLDLVEEMSQIEESIELNDSFDIELNEDTIIETGVVGFMEDGVIVQGDDVVMEMLSEKMVLGSGSDATDSAVQFEDELDEAEYQGRKVQLNKPMQGDVAKSKVYVKGPKGNVVKVNFGDPNMRIKKSNPARRKSFRARHNCDNPGPKWKARYWSCRAW